MNVEQNNLIMSKIVMTIESLERAKKQLKSAKLILMESFVSNGKQYKNRMIELENALSDIVIEIKHLEVLYESIK